MNSFQQVGIRLCGRTERSELLNTFKIIKKVKTKEQNNALPARGKNTNSTLILCKPLYRAIPLGLVSIVS